MWTPSKKSLNEKLIWDVRHFGKPQMKKNTRKKVLSILKKLNLHIHVWCEETSKFKKTTNNFIYIPTLLIFDKFWDSHI